MSKLRVLDLFSGIGGFSLGLERTGGFETVQFCEIDPYCQRVLRKHWPEVPIENDINSWVSLSDSQCCRTADGQSPGIETPDWLVIENTGHRWRAWVPKLRSQLWTIGYSSLPIRVRASDLGFRHRRSRVFVIAHTDSERLRQLSRWWSGEGGQVAQKLDRTWRHGAIRLGRDHGVPKKLDRHRRRMLGNAIVPQIAELIGHAILAAEGAEG